MMFTKQKLFILLSLFITPVIASAQSIDVQNIQKIYLDMYPVKGLVWQGKSTQNTTWNKIAETPDGKIWFAGGDHWGTGGVTGSFDEQDRYKRPWGFGNTAVSFYDPDKDKSFVAFNLDKASALFSNAETPGHGKIHSNLATDSEGNIYTAGYLGNSYAHEWDDRHYPKSYAGGALIKYDPKTKDVDYYGIPVPGGGITAIYYDEKRNIINGLSIAKEQFWRINLTTRELNRYEAGMGAREMIMDQNGVCYFRNAVHGLTKFNPDTQEFTDIDVELPGNTQETPFRATTVSSDNIIYGVSREGLVWQFNPQTNTLKEFGHELGLPNKFIYTPNIALDEEWNRLYFLAGSHGLGLEGHPSILTVLDLKTGKFHWVGQVEGVEGCFGSLVAENHSVYFNSYGYLYKNEEKVKNKNGKIVRRPFLVRYNPPKDLSKLNEN